MATEAVRAMLIEKIDLALRPPVHERRVPSGGTILDPASDPTTWGPGTLLDIALRDQRLRGPIP